MEYTSAGLLFSANTYNHPSGGWNRNTILYHIDEDDSARLAFLTLEVPANS